MTTAIEQMLRGYNVGSIYDKKNAMKEIIQEIVLCGLYRAGFFKKAAFYGAAPPLEFFMVWIDFQKTWTSLSK